LDERTSRKVKLADAWIHWPAGSMSTPCTGKADLELIVTIQNGTLRYQLPNGTYTNGDLNPAKKQKVRWSSTVADLVIRIEKPILENSVRDKSPFQESMYCGSREDGNATACIETTVKDKHDVLGEYKYTAVLIQNNGTCVSQDPRIIIRESVDN